MKKVFKILSFALASFLSAFFICVNAFASSEFVGPVNPSEPSYDVQSAISEATFSQSATLFRSFSDYDPTNKEDKTLTKYVVLAVFDKTDNKYYILSNGGIKYFFFGQYWTNFPYYTCFGSDDNLTVYCGKNISSGANNSGFVHTQILNPHIEYVDFGTYKEYYLNLTFLGSIYQNGETIKSIDTNVNYKFQNITTTSNTCSEDFTEHEFYINTRIFSSTKDASDYADEILNGNYSRLPDDVAAPLKKSPSAKLMTAPQSDSEKALGGVLKVSQSWLNGSGPFVSFVINDNGNGHKYKLRISYNSEIVGKLEEIISAYKFKEDYEWLFIPGDCIGTVLKWFTLGSYPTSTELFENGIESVYNVIDAKYLSYVNNMNSFTFDLLKEFSGSDFTFNADSVPVINSRVISVDLCDYINIPYHNSYKIEVIDVTTKQTLDYTYLISNENYNINDVKTGTKIYDYTDSDLAWRDIINNDPSNFFSKRVDDLLDTDSNTINSHIPDSMSDSITSMLADTNSLNSLKTSIDTALNGVGIFFSMCYEIIPPVYLSIIAVAAVGLVILRILGR